MKFILFFIVGTVLITLPAFASGPVWYDKPQEPKTNLIIRAKEYYKDVYALNTTKACTGTNCLPVGTRVSCSKYTLVSLGDGTQLQFCHINLIKFTDKSEIIDVSADKYVMATGFIAKNKKFTMGLPSNRIFNGPKIEDQTTKKEEKKVEGQVCDSNCANDGKDRLYYFIKNLENTISPKKAGSVNPALKEKVGDVVESQIKNQKIAKACSNFINEDGELGPWGKKAVNAIKKVDWDCFNNEIDTSRVCPNYKDFNENKKEYFWVWTLASMAHIESSCNVKAVNPRAKNETGYGLMQMENTKYRRKSDRDGRYCPHHKINEQDVSFQMECTASIFSDTYCKNGLGLTSRRGYWAQLLSPKRKIAVQIKKFPGCF